MFCVVGSCQALKPAHSGLIVFMAAVPTIIPLRNAREVKVVCFHLKGIYKTKIWVQRA